MSLRRGCFAAVLSALFLSALFLSALVAAAPVNAATESAANTAALIEKLEQRIALGEKVSGSFQQKKYIAVLPEPLQSHGKFTYDHDNGLLWETLAPIANRLVFDKHGIRQSVDGKLVWEVDGQQPAVVTITRVISGVLATDWVTLQAYFSLDGSVDAQGWHLRLTPKDDVLEQIISAISVSGDRVLSAMTLYESNGDRTEIVFTVQQFSDQP